MTGLRLASLLLPLVLACHAVSAGDLEPRGESVLETWLSGDASKGELFLRCCWARGRAGFHFCEEYGVCESDPEAVCKGVGAAEGMSVSCKTGPPEFADERG